MPTKAQLEKKISDLKKELHAHQVNIDHLTNNLRKPNLNQREIDYFTQLKNAHQREIDKFISMIDAETKALADLERPVYRSIPPLTSTIRTLPPSSNQEIDSENQRYADQAKEDAQAQTQERPRQYPNFQSRITVPNVEGVDATAILRQHAIDRILEENRRGYTPFPDSTIAPPDPLELEARARTIDLARGVDRTSQRVSALQRIQERILSNAERHGELSPEGRERLAFAAGIPKREDLIRDAKDETLALMELIKKRNYDRYEYDRSRRMDELNKKLTGRMALGKTWDSGDAKALQKFKIHEEQLMKELQDKLDDTEKGIFREALNNAHGRDSSTRQRVMQGVDRELQGNAQGFGQAQALAHERRAQSDAEYQNYLHRLRLMQEAGGEQRQRAQEIIAEQMRRFEDARNHNTAQVNTLANFVHGQPMPFIRPYVTPDGMPAPTAPRNHGTDLFGLGLQGAGTVMDLYNRYQNANRPAAAAGSR